MDIGPSRRRNPFGDPMSHLWVIAYDISDTKRRYRVEKALAGWGERIELSIFECWLQPGQFNRLRSELRYWLEAGDRINYYRVCKCCLPRRHWQGAATGTQAESFQVI